MPKLLRSYLFWTYQRGSFHYDVMVTLILLFLFISPHLINFRDRPTENLGIHNSEVLVTGTRMTPNGMEFRYEIRADDLRSAATDDQREDAMLRIIEPIAGDVTLERWEPVRDSTGKLIAYNAWVIR